MSFNYDQIRKKHEEGHTNWWTSYADLFMMLSVVFLLMYVSATLRSGAAGYLKQQEYQRVAKENSDLKEQIKVYNTLKDQQLQTQSQNEQQVYAKLMDKLKLLKDEAREEKEALNAKAKENEEKEFALNEYQQVVRNIINANILAKAQIQRRDTVIQTKDQTLNEKEQVITQQNDEIRAKEQLIAQNEVKIQEINQKLKNKIEQVKREQKWAHHTRKETEKRIAKLRKESAAQIAALDESKAQAIASLRAKREEAERKARALEGNLVGLSGKVKETEAKLAGAEQEKGRYLAEVKGLKSENASMQGDLEKARAQANARRELAKSIGTAFKKAGIKAAVDDKTGAVTLDFGEEYFDTGRAELKPAMVHKLDQFFPIYTDSLFNNPKSADKIANVEIIGFASSTYKGKYVNPESLKPEDQEAVSYNLKLSFSRANEIFKHVYARKTLTSNQKKKLLPLIKVVGRGYLPDGRSPSEIREGISEAEFCKTYNCKKAQRVVVKFNLKD